MIQQICVNAALVVGGVLALVFLQGFIIGLFEGFGRRARPKLRIFVGECHEDSN